MTKKEFRSYVEKLHGTLRGVAAGTAYAITEVESVDPELVTKLKEVRDASESVARFIQNRLNG